MVQLNKKIVLRKTTSLLEKSKGLCYIKARKLVENLVLIDKEFILEDFKEEEADIIYKVNIDGKNIIF